MNRRPCEFPLSPQEMLTKLISFNTVSDRSNLDLIAFVEDYLTDLESRAFAYRMKPETRPPCMPASDLLPMAV